MPSNPLVSIGLPTYNRAASVSRAIESVLTQDYSNIELVISDNASADATEAICREAGVRDNRVKYFRQQSNLGATENFREVLRQSSGEFFMWLADDDWLDRSYVGRCMEVLVEFPDYSLVCGADQYFDGAKFIRDGRPTNLLHERGSERVLAYYEQVQDNGTFHGVMRRTQIVRAPIRNTLAGDWLVIAAVAFMGKVKTLEDTYVNRTVGGASDSFEKLAATLGLSPLSIRHPNLSVAAAASNDIVYRSAAYSKDGLFRRLWLGCKVFATIADRGSTLFERNVYSRYLPRPLAITVMNKVLPASVLDMIRARRRQRRARANDHRV